MSLKNISLLTTEKCWSLNAFFRLWKNVGQDKQRRSRTRGNLVWHPLSCTWRKSAGRIPFSLGKKPQCLKRQGFVEDWLPSSQSSVENKNGGTLVQKEFQESRGPSKHSPGSPLSPSAINPLDDPKAQSYRAGPWLFISRERHSSVL